MCKNLLIKNRYFVFSIENQIVAVIKIFLFYARNLIGAVCTTRYNCYNYS